MEATRKQQSRTVEGVRLVADGYASWATEDGRYGFVPEPRVYGRNQTWTTFNGEQKVDEGNSLKVAVRRALS